MSPPAPTTTVPRPWSVFRRLEERLFARDGLDPSNRSGARESGKPEWFAYLLALGIGILTAALVELAMGAYPVPSGGDPGQWIASSFPFVGLPYPSWIVPGEYPPLLFPILGTFVRLFGPLQAGRAYVAFAAILLGLSTYFFARTIVRSRAVALGVEAFVLLSPTMIQSYFWGIYPNLLGLICMNFALAFLLRFIRSGNPSNVFGFWLASAATILAHTLVAVVFLGTLAILLGVLLWQRRIPRAIYRSPMSWLGGAVFATSVGGYYLLTKLAGVPHPQYLQTSAFAYVRNGIGQLFTLLLNPYFPGIHSSVPVAEFVALSLATLLVLALVGLRLLAPRRLSLGVLLVVAMLATVVGGAIVGWELSVVTDYLRFGFFLIVPLGLGFGLLVDAALHWAPEPAPAEHRSPDPPSAAPPIAVRPSPTQGLPTRRWRALLPRGWTPVGTVVFALAVAGLLLSTVLVTAPELPGVEQTNSNSFHDAAFLRAVHDIGKSGVSGNVFALAGAAKWTRALLDRNAYTPFVASRYAFDPAHLNYEEIAYFAMVSRDTVTNNLLAATIAGTNATLDNQTPDYEASFFGVFTPVVTIVPENFNVTVTGTGNGSSYRQGITAAPRIVPPTTPGPSMELVYTEPEFVLTVSIVLSPDAPTARYGYTFVATAGWSLTAVRGNITGPSAGTYSTNVRTGATPGALLLSPTTGAGALQTFANVTPGTIVAHPQSYNRAVNQSTGGTGTLVARAPLLWNAPPRGSAAFNFSVQFATPGAQNLIDNLPPFIDTPTVWQNWSIRFMLLANNSTFILNHPSAILWEAPYLEGEYGARILAVEASPVDTWTVVLLPAPSQVRS